MIPFDGGFLYRLSFVTIAISNRSTAICSRISDVQINRGESFWDKICGERVDRYKQNFNKILERHGTVLCKRNRVDIFCRLSTMHERDGQTDKQTNHGTVRRNIDRNSQFAIGEFACQRYRLKMPN